jgi:osmotically-inducible protein OsmY
MSEQPWNARGRNGPDRDQRRGYGYEGDLGYGPRANDEDPRYSGRSDLSSAESDYGVASRFRGDQGYGDDGRGYGQGPRYGRDRDRGYPEGGYRGGRGDEFGRYGERIYGEVGPGGAYGEAYRGDAGYGGYGGIRRGGDLGEGARESRRDRSWWERTKDEVSSWAGDEDAARRRRMDEALDHRGRGPKNYARSDDRIREDVNDRLTDDSAVDATEIDVKVSNREVTLSGTVDSRMEKRRAEDCAERVSGVQHVQNNLRVKTPSPVIASGTPVVGAASRSGATNSQAAANAKSH